MIRLSASLSKKVPIEGLSYSSQSFMAGLEVEISEQSNNSQICSRMRELYQMLEESINDQIRQHNKNESVPNKSADMSNRTSQPRNSQKRRENKNYPASQAQLKAIAAIRHERELEEVELSRIIRQNFSKEAPADLSMKEASKLITLLNSQGREAG